MVTEANYLLIKKNIKTKKEKKEKKVIHIFRKKGSKTMQIEYGKSQLSLNGVGLTKPPNTSLSPTSKHPSHLRKPGKDRR